MTLGLQSPGSGGAQDLKVAWASQILSNSPRWSCHLWITMCIKCTCHQGRSGPQLKKPKMYCRLCNITWWLSYWHLPYRQTSWHLSVYPGIRLYLQPCVTYDHGAVMLSHAPASNWKSGKNKVKAKVLVLLYNIVLYIARQLFRQI